LIGLDSLTALAGASGGSPYVAAKTCRRDPVSSVAHRVRNTAGTTAISIHVYGTDVARVGSSVRRYYD
jgi:hypothetical protein